MSYIKLFVVAGLAATAGLAMTFDQASAGSLAYVEVDVSENALRFSFDEDKVFPEDGYPTYGSSFVTEGYIYPKNTLNGSNGVNPDGSPQFPGSVIGKWTCRGFMIGDGAHTATGAWVISTQLYEFTSGSYSGRSVVTDGTELVDIGVWGYRAITGGTSWWKEAEGQQSQRLKGFNVLGGAVLETKLDIRD